MISLFFGNPDHKPGWEQKSNSGHRWYSGGPRLRAVDHRYAERLCPWGKIDGVLAPRPDGSRHREYPQGVAALHHKEDWTAISFWDRSGDHRGNSSTTFIFDRTLTWEEALAQAEADFPQLFERFPFEVVLLEGSTPKMPSNGQEHTNTKCPILEH